MKDLALIDSFAQRYHWTHDYVTEMTIEFFYQLNLLHILQNAEGRKADLFIADAQRIKSKTK